MSTPSEANGTEQWTTLGPSGASSQRMLVTSTSPAGQPLAGILRPLIRNPPSTSVAVPLDSSQSDAPVEISTSFAAATLAKTGAGRSWL